MLSFYKPEDEEQVNYLKKKFERADVSGDQKLSFAGNKPFFYKLNETLTILSEFLILAFFAIDREEDYKAAKKID